MVRGEHGSTVVVRRDRHDGVGPDLTQLPLLLPPLPLPAGHNQIVIINTIIIIITIIFTK